MNINQYIKENRQGKSGIVRPVVCADGLEMSVQASPIHYCVPREFAESYTHVEIGFPSMVIHALMPYCEDRMDPRDTVYHYVPVEVVERVIANHGGFAK